MTPTISVKNFERFQHYKDRSPPWIKLYNDLLEDYNFGQLPDASKMHLIAIWLLASRSENKIPGDAVWIARRINAREKVNLQLLIDAGFLLINQPLPVVGQIASKTLAKCLSREREETEERRDRGETESGGAEAPSPTELPKLNGTKLSLKLGTRLPDDWQQLDEDWDKARADGLTDDEIKYEDAQFKAHFWAKSGKDATKLNWDMTWQKWMRKAAHDKREKQHREKAWNARFEQQRRN